MTTRPFNVLLAMFVLLTSIGAAQANGLLMARIPMKADIAMEYLQTAITDHGYHIAHIQKCDSGMSGFGYKTDFYKVIFFGKLDEIRRISAKHPGFSAYLPLKVTVVAEGDETVLTLVDPLNFRPFFNEDRDILSQLRRWHNDAQSFFDALLRESEPLGGHEY